MTTWLSGTRRVLSKLIVAALFVLPWDIFMQEGVSLPYVPRVMASLLCSAIGFDTTMAIFANATGHRLCCSVVPQVFYFKRGGLGSFQRNQLVRTDYSLLIVNFLMGPSTVDLLIEDFRDGVEYSRYAIVVLSIYVTIYPC